MERIFEWQERIIFVDNDEIFKNTIIREGNREYFRDMFGSDFGHFTERSK
ncbi:MAG: hypothetical protein KKG43_04135 [Candidatus Omnitrophica bacterium]|nr:hypothetical protein [Candidatus Omnitrophota bacterium]MBU1928695.1 hypothetical protein [Candidatus Omnitrophota bacterium]MBU2222157.1 hypothetical protein [Candidatus Omnitrophota bacterium]MBU2257824.1 hypothetical protein [Candidatus Omnitrophota bacterium]